MCPLTNNHQHQAPKPHHGVLRACDPRLKTLSRHAFTPPRHPSPRGKPRSLTGLLPFLHPYRARIAWALLCLVMAALATLAFPLALRNLIDTGLVSADRADQAMALREHFGALFLVAVALGVFPPPASMP